MADYNIVARCRLCRARMLLGKKDAKVYYCSKCEKKLNNAAKRG